MTLTRRDSRDPVTVSEATCGGIHLSDLSNVHIVEPYDSLVASNFIFTLIARFFHCTHPLLKV